MKRKIFDMGKNFKDFKPIDLHEAFVDESADEEIMKNLTDPNPSTYSATAKQTDTVTVETIRKAADEFNKSFIPEIWSKKLLGEFYEKTVIPKFFKSDPIRELTRDIKKLSDEGLTPQEIADKIDPEKYFGQVAYLYPWKVWRVDGKVEKDKVIIKAIHS